MLAHNHEHNDYSEKEALEVILPYLLKHNNNHIKEIEKWIKRAESTGYEKVAQDLREVLELSFKISEYFESAIKKLKINKSVKLRSC